MTNLNDLIFAREAAEILNVSPRTVSRMAETGKLPIAIKGTGKTTSNLYRRADVERLARQRQASAA